MPINLGDLRRHLGRDLQDAIFEGLSLEVRDWRASVPMEIRHVWRDMNMNERLGVYLMARYSALEPH